MLSNFTFQIEEAILPEPKTSEENDALINSYGHLDFWLGINDLATENEFKYESDGTDVTFFDWGVGVTPVPNNGEGIVEEDCVHYWTAYGAWNDLDCATPFTSYVCQINL